MKKRFSTELSNFQPDDYDRCRSVFQEFEKMYLQHIGHPDHSFETAGIYVSTLSMQSLVEKALQGKSSMTDALSVVLEYLLIIEEKCEMKGRYVGWF